MIDKNCVEIIIVLVLRAIVLIESLFKTDFILNSCACMQKLKKQHWSILFQKRAKKWFFMMQNAALNENKVYLIS